MLLKIIDYKTNKQLVNLKQKPEFSISFLQYASKYCVSLVHGGQKVSCFTWLLCIIPINGNLSIGNTSIRATDLLLCSGRVSIRLVSLVRNAEVCPTCLLDATGLWICVEIVMVS